MKNLFAILLAVIIAGSTSAFTGGPGNDPRAEKEFARQYAGAQNVKWTSLEDGYLKVTFTLNNVRAESFFNEDAELLGTIRNIFYSQAPLAVSQTVSGRFGAALPVEVKEITTRDATFYRVVIEKDSKKYNLRINSQGYIVEQVKEKIKK